jgi:hypothetical protein
LASSWGQILHPGDQGIDNLVEVSQLLITFVQFKRKRIMKLGHFLAAPKSPTERGFFRFTFYIRLVEKMLYFKFENNCKGSSQEVQTVQG